MRFTEGIPSCPEELGPVAREEWRRIAGELSKVPGLVQRVDRAALAAYCSSWALFAWAEAEIRETGPVYEAVAKSGDVLIRPHPAVAIRDNALRQLRAFALEFGFTPSSRTAVKQPKGKDSAGLLARYIG